MKKITCLMALAALLFMLAACGDKQANKEQTDENQKEIAVKEKTDADKATDHDSAELNSIEEDEYHKLPEISSVWASKPISTIAADNTADIEHFAFAFCKEYSIYKPNKIIAEYLEFPSKYNNENSLFYINNQKKNGYISCCIQTENDWNTVCCYWKRNNGHKLVAFWMIERLENYEKDDHLLVFYDYDPKTDNMTPEPKLSKMVEEAMSGFDTYTVLLPEQGKDINLTGHKINLENDNMDNTYFLLRWNGNDFKMERVEDE